MKNLILFLSFLLLILIAFDTKAQITLITQGFNGTTTPTGWATTVVNDPGADPTITYVSSSIYPTVTSPNEGTRFVNFNSYYCANLAEIRLHQSTSFSTMGYYAITVNFAWYESSSGPLYTGEGVTIQWSTNGTTWTNATFYPRYNTIEGWKDKSCVLPIGAINQGTLYIAFLFHSEYGYNCHIDDVTTTGLPAQDYQITFSGTGASTTVDSIRVENLNQCTSEILHGGDILLLDATVEINNIASGSSSRLLIYPNPVTENCFVEFEMPVSGIVDLLISDITGKIIIQTQSKLSQGHHRYQIKGLSSGVYPIRINTEAFSYTGKIISNSSKTATAEIKYENLNTTVEILNNEKSKGAKSQNEKGTSSLIQMQYTPGDLLKFTGYSGIYKTVQVLTPTQSQNLAFTFVPCTDASGNNYSVVQIGTQTWMAENLKTTKHTDGTSINFVEDPNSWSYLSTEGYCNPQDIPANSDTFGHMYNWYAVNATAGICPIGWHKSTDAEWTQLENYLGGGTVAGAKMKESCSIYWNDDFSTANNNSGFTALPKGGRDSGGGWAGFFSPQCYMWSSTEYGPDCTQGWYRIIGPGYPTILRNYQDKRSGFFVRCIKN